MTTELYVGDRVKCTAPGSWVDGRAGTVSALNVVSSDGIEGHQLKIDTFGGYTVVPPAELTLIPDLAAAHRRAGDLVEKAAELVRQAAIRLSGTGWSRMLSNTTSELHDLARRVRDYDPTGG